MTDTHDEKPAPEGRLSILEIIVLLCVAVVLIFVGLLTQYLELFTDERVAKALVATGIAVIVFGVLRATARIALGPEHSAFPFVNKVSIGGALAGLYVIFGLLNTDEPVVVVVTDPHIVSVGFVAPYYAGDEALHRTDLSLSQLQPRLSLQKHRITAQHDATANWGEYLVPNNLLAPPPSPYKIKLKRQIESSFRGSPNSIPGFEICFKVLSRELQNPHFDCDSPVCRISTPSSHLEMCEAADVERRDSDGAASFWQIIRTAYADDDLPSPQGWITPSLETLAANHRARAETYVEFTVATDALNLPDDVDRYTFQVLVNDTAIYIDGWSEAETLTRFDPKTRFELSFGFQNLDFAGVHDGDEELSVILTFFAGDDVNRIDRIERSYTALRVVEPAEFKKGDTVYSWTGEQHFSKTDGFEVIFWSSPDSAELINRRKVFFDDEDIEFDGLTATAVVRPPLGDNINYGLIIGLEDKLGRIDFTFDEDKAKAIRTWLENDIKDQRTREREETGFTHPLIKTPNIYETHSND